MTIAPMNQHRNGEQCRAPWFEGDIRNGHAQMATHTQADRHTHTTTSSIEIGLTIRKGPSEQVKRDDKAPLAKC